MADKYSWSNATNYDVGNADGVKGNVTQWSRSTVADGKWLNQETILPMSGRDQYLLDSLNDVDNDVKSCVDRIELLETSATDHENRLQKMQLEIDDKQDLLTSNNAGFGIQINQEEPEGVPSHPVIAVDAHNTDNITVHSQQGSTSVGFALNEDISVNSITALENGEGKKITGFNAVYTESIGLQDESDSITTEEIINGLTNTVSLQGLKSISISEPDSSNVSNVSVITHKTGPTEDGGLSVDDSGLKVNVDNSSIQISSNTIGAKLKTNGGLEKDTNGIGVKVNKSSMELDANGVGVKINSKGGLKTGEYGVQVKLHTNEDSKDEDSGLETNEQGLKVNVDGKTITINNDNQLVGSDGLPEYNTGDIGCVLRVNSNQGGLHVGWEDPNDTIDIDNQTILSKINGVDGLGVHNSSRFVYHTSDAAFTSSPVYTSLFHCNQTNLSDYNLQEMFKPNSLFANTSVANSSLFTKTWPVNITDMTWNNTKNVYMWSQGSYLTLVDLSFNININWNDVVNIKKTDRCQKKHEVYLGRFTYSPSSAKTLYLYPPAGKYTDARYLIDCSIVYPTAGYCCCIKGLKSVPCSCNLNGGYYGLASHAEPSNGDTECWGDLYCCMNINDLPEEDVTFIGNLTFNVMTTPGLVPQDDPNIPVIHYRYMK